MPHTRRFLQCFGAQTRRHEYFCTINKKYCLEICSVKKRCFQRNETSYREATSTVGFVFEQIMCLYCSNNNNMVAQLLLPAQRCSEVLQHDTSDEKYLCMFPRVDHFIHTLRSFCYFRVKHLFNFLHSSAYVFTLKVHYATFLRVYKQRAFGARNSSFYMQI